MKKYRFHKLSVISVSIAAVLGLGSIFFSTDFQFDVVSVLVLVFLILLPLDLAFGTYVTLNEKTFSRTDYFFLKKQISISDIVSLRYRPTYGLGSEFSTLHVFERGKNEAVISMTSIWFTEKILSKFINDLIKHNSNINLDESSINLMNKYK